jgi:tetratricopeptide (TPR) repeat protein
MQRLFCGKISVLAAREKSPTKEPMPRLRGRSQNRESLESCPEDPGAAFPRQHCGAAKARPRLIALLLAFVTLLVYLPVAGHGFSIFDDPDYVTGNRVVQNGLTRAGIEWAFTTWHASNWHPLTWLSHMLDCELFGLNAGAHHLVNVLLHAANTVLLFGLLWRLMNALWPGAFVAALFAWHPLHVESVAWISERKDVLSTFFALLTLLAYARYAQKRSRVEGREARADAAVPALDPRRSTLDCAPALFFFALGLMAKPMLVTLPFVMLLLDYWPLERFRVPGSAFQVRNLFREKIPFFVLAAASCVITFLAQHRGGMVVSLQEIPLLYRLENVPLAYLRYLFKMLWPAHLVIFYPLTKTIAPLAGFSATAGLASITAAVWLGRRRCPYGLVGWLWFLGTLVPVIGLVQVGQAAMSDRYSYFPLIGLFIAITFAIRDGAARLRLPSVAGITAAALILGGFVALTEKQLRCWRDDESLFAHAVSVTRDNEPAHLCLGQVYEMQGRKAEALTEYQTGLKLNPYRIKTYSNVAHLLASTGQTNAALAAMRAALRLSPADAPSHDTLANLLADSGHTNAALAEFREAVRLNPRDAALQDNLGAMLVEAGRFDEAMEHYAAAARGDPADWRAPYLSGKALLKQGRDREAMPYLRQALQIEPDNLQTLVHLAQVLASDENPQVRDGQTAFDLASRANALTGGAQPAMLDALGMACAELGHFDEAQKAAQDALHLLQAGGVTNDATEVRQRLQLYQNHQPFRQSFAKVP